jgi:hypothetical protein
LRIGQYSLMGGVTTILLTLLEVPRQIRQMIKKISYKSWRTKEKFKKSLIISNLFNPFLHPWTIISSNVMKNRTIKTRLSTHPLKPKKTAYSRLNWTQPRYNFLLEARNTDKTGELHTVYPLIRFASLVT